MTYDESETCWHILTVTKGGVVSILKNLDAPTARATYQRLQPRTRPVKLLNEPKPGERRLSGSWRSESSVMSSSQYDREFRDVHILGPEGAKLDPWRGAEPEIIDLAERRDRPRRHTGIA